MTRITRKLLELLVLLLALGTATPAMASAWSLRGDATPAPRKELLWGLPRDDPAIAVGAVVLALLIFVAVAWVAARVGDKS